MAASSRTFHWADYLLFILMLAVSSAIGVFYACQARRKAITMDAHLTGDRKMTLIPVTFSICVSFMSAVFILGIPSEIYNNGGIYWLYAIGYIPVYIVSALVFVPMFTSLNLSSGYQYLERRFNGYIRVLGSATFTIEMVIYMGVVMYAPALALSQVTSFSTEMSILIMGVVCTFYTSIGGIKAVIWTDVFQMCIITAGLLALMIQGAMSVGGWQVVLDRVREGGKLPYFEWNPDPFVRHTFWTLSVGGFFTSLTVFAANQAVLQRYMSLPDTRQAKLSLLLNLPLAEIFLALVCLTGFVIYARFHNDDPLENGSITKSDQIVPFYMMETLGFIPGLTGLFVASVFSAALSTVSSGINSLAVVTIVDFIKPALDKFRSGRTSARLIAVLSLATAISYGVITTGVAYLAGLLGATVLQIALSIFGMVGGPLLGLFVNGMFVPCVNAWGAAAGLVCSLSMCMWLGVGGALHRAKNAVVAASAINNTTVIAFSNTTINTTHTILQFINTNTLYVNQTSNSSTARYVGDMTTTLPPPMNVTDVATTTSLDAFLSKWYSLSYLHYATVALIVSVVVGILVSACTGFNKKRYVDRETYYDVLCCCKSDTDKKYDLNSYGITDLSQTDRNGKKTELVNLRDSTTTSHESIHDGSHV
ncbi:sodium-coupled monocarboxylate transporter 1-like [Haliotis cracherodii]|uniref:sodium-coupled monocarboxylate transporter 1-like n=1 Tax=Haliotis cracherodii TaxID=6455 RepID=UPI0039E79BD7